MTTDILHTESIVCKMSVDSISTVKDEKLDAEIYFRGNISMCNSQWNEQQTSSFLQKIKKFPIIICVLKTRKDKKIEHSREKRGTKRKL